MPRFRQAVSDLGIPMPLGLLLWSAFGHGLFGVRIGMAWVVVLAVVAPLVLVCTAVSTMLMRRQRRCPVPITAPQAWLQVLCWVCMFVAGMAIEDGDFFGEQSYGGILINLFGGGPTARTFSETILQLCEDIWAGAWSILAVSLIVGLARQRFAPADRRS